MMNCMHTYKWNYPFLFPKLPNVRPPHQPYMVLLPLIVLQRCFPLPHSLHILGPSFCPMVLAFGSTPPLCVFANGLCEEPQSQNAAYL